MDCASSTQNTNNTRGRGRGDGRGRGRGRGQDPSSRGRGRGQYQDQTPSYRGRGRGQSHNPSSRGQHEDTPFRSRGRGGPRGGGTQYRIPGEARPVPSFSSISPSTPVSIILKQDQPTGRTVTGIVADLLTRGDHPRGVKVRLRDGRVGRVQAIISQDDGERGESLAGGIGANLGRNGENGGGDGAWSGTGGRGGRSYRQERDIRDDDEYLYDETRGNERANEGWFAALEAADRKHEAKKTGEMVDEEGYGVVECPVCGVFRGDERAVQHHVEGHYVDNYK